MHAMCLYLNLEKGAGTLSNDMNASILSLTFGLELLSVGVPVCRPPLHHPSPVETWWFEHILPLKETHIHAKCRTSDRLIMQKTIVPLRNRVVAHL